MLPALCHYRMLTLSRKTSKVFVAAVRIHNDATRDVIIILRSTTQPTSAVIHCRDDVMRHHDDAPDRMILNSDCTLLPLIAARHAFTTWVLYFPTETQFARSKRCHKI